MITVARARRLISGIVRRGALCLALATACASSRGGPPPAAAPGDVPATPPARPRVLVDVGARPEPARPPVGIPARQAPAAPPAPAYLLEPPTWLLAIDQLTDDVELLDVRALALATPQAPQVFVPRAPRPAIPGDALYLAELALDRGDPLDASAQLRPLVARASSDERPYLELQLVRAYVALGRLDDAQALLEVAIERGTTASWPAVFELATLLVRDRGEDAYDTWQRLSPHVPSLEEQLAHHLIGSTGDERALSKFARAFGLAPWSLLRCRRELVAFEATRPYGLPSWRLCPVRRTSRVHVPRSADERRQLRDLALYALLWRAVAARQPPREDDWILVADRCADIVARDPSTPAALLASWLALLAYQNAANEAAARGGAWIMLRDHVVHASARIDQTHPAFRDEIRRVADSFIQATP